jgi:predicted nucleotidyltransferase
VLFGSAATDRGHANSDIDIGIIPRDPDLLFSAELTLQARLEAATGRSVDLVRLDQASTLLKWEAAKSGVCLLADAAHTFSRFVAESALDHADLMPTLGATAERFRQRLASSAPSSVPSVSKAGE